MADDRVERVAAVLRQAAETHHAVHGIVDGEDPDWATFVRAAAEPADGPWDLADARAIVAETG